MVGTSVVVEGHPVVASGADDTIATGILDST